MNYNSLLVKYKNSWQLRTYQFTIKSDLHNELDSYDVFPAENAKKSISFEKTENEIDKAFSKYDTKYHFDNRSAYVSVNRSKNKIFYYARSNDWNQGYFCTLTFDQKKYNSFDFKEISKCVQNFTHTLRLYDCNLYALFVPEKHKSGAFHFHGLISKHISDKLVFSGHIKNGYKIFNLPLWKYGFSNLTLVKNTLAVEKYVTKYTTKELLNDTKFQHRYFMTNLQEAEIIKLNLYDQEQLFQDLALNGCTLFCRTDGTYNRTTYSEIKNDEKTLTIINKYVTISDGLKAQNNNSSFGRKGIKK